jgi:hypothetical protein
MEIDQVNMNSIDFNLHIESYQDVLSYKHQQIDDISNSEEFCAMASLCRLTLVIGIWRMCTSELTKSNNERENRIVQ